ncbi:MAG: hypothetical protein ISS79_07140 [Phycisphaerae bacterium]|nr:hypothetical protein [Phycisphaerae bacterium]
MDSASGLLLREAVPMPTPLIEAGKSDVASEARRIQAVKDFESVLITRLISAMENTIGDWGVEKDATSKQVRGIFSMYLGRHIGSNGGFGMWKDIYKSLHNATSPKREHGDRNYKP